MAKTDIFKIDTILDVENIFYHSMTTLKIGSFWDSIGSVS